MQIKRVLSTLPNIGRQLSEIFLDLGDNAMNFKALFLEKTETKHIIP